MDSNLHDIYSRKFRTIKWVAACMTGCMQVKRQALKKNWNVWESLQNVSSWNRMAFHCVYLLLQAVSGCCNIIWTTAQVSVVIVTRDPADDTAEPAKAAVSAVNVLATQMNTDPIMTYHTGTYTFLTDVGQCTHSVNWFWAFYFILRWNFPLVYTRDLSS
jgi:hypothetical protein